MAELEPKPTAALAPKSVIITTGLGNLECLEPQNCVPRIGKKTKDSMEKYKWRNRVVKFHKLLHASFWWHLCWLSKEKERRALGSCQHSQPSVPATAAYLFLPVPTIILSQWY